MWDSYYRLLGVRMRSEGGHVAMMCSVLLCYVVVGSAVKWESRCMRHYKVHLIRHPARECETKTVLLTRCEGFCSRSSTESLVSFQPVLLYPFHHRCECCRDRLSVMKALRLQCTDGNFVFATYRYIIRCGCDLCV